MAADALVSVGVVAAGAIYLWLAWGWVDPVASLIVATVVVAGTWSLFRDSLHLLFDGVPRGIDVRDVRATLLALQGVQGLHELHVWGMATSETALTAHLVVGDPQADRDLLLRSATYLLKDRFKIRHVTLQLESAACPSDIRC